MLKKYLLKSKFILIVLTLTLSQHAFAQDVISPSYPSLESLTFYGTYSKAVTSGFLGGSNKLDVYNAEGFGGGAEFSFEVFDKVYINLHGGYTNYTIHQDSALIQWNWRFWDVRYRNMVRSNLASDSSLRATISPVQKMTVIPVILTVGYKFRPVKNLYIMPYAGGGILFYTRSLYIDEYWEKYFQQIDYTFGYGYRNFANDKKGNPAVLNGGIDITYSVSNIIRIQSKINYLHVIKTEGSMGYNDFPFNSALNLNLGITFMY